MPEGLNQNARESEINNYTDGDLHLCTTAIEDSDGETELTTKSAKSISVSAADFTLTSDTVAGTSQLVNQADLEFGSTDIGVVEDVVLQHATELDKFIIGEDPDNPDLTGENYTILQGDFEYTLGGE